VKILLKSENGGLICCHWSIRRLRPAAGKVQSRAPPGGMSARLRAGSLRLRSWVPVWTWP